VRLYLRTAATNRLNVHPPGDKWAWTAIIMMPSGDNYWLVHQSSLTVLPADTSEASRRNGRRSENFAYQYLKYLKGSLTCRKIWRHGTSGFTPHPMEGVLRDFISIKNPSPLPGLKPRPLGPVASTLTIIPQRRLYLPYSTMRLREMSLDNSSPVKLWFKPWNWTCPITSKHDRNWHIQHAEFNKSGILEKIRWYHPTTYQSTRNRGTSFYLQLFTRLSPRQITTETNINRYYDDNHACYTNIRHVTWFWRESFEIWRKRLYFRLTRPEHTRTHRYSNVDLPDYSQNTFWITQSRDIDFCKCNISVWDLRLSRWQWCHVRLLGCNAIWTCIGR
jgi:hypothetical protein